MRSRSRSPGRDSLLRVPIARVVGDSFSVTVRYGGEPKDGLIIRTDSAGRWTAFGDNWPNRARNWIPGIDHPSDKATVTWTVRAPSERRVVANGELMEETPLPARAGLSSADADAVARVPADTRRISWSSPRHRSCTTISAVRAAASASSAPASGSPCMSSRNRAISSRAHSRTRRRWCASSRSLSPRFRTRSSPISQSSTRYGGMENAGAIFYADAPFRRRTMQPGVIAHETAHQWFGDAVTEREWSHVWLSEGFATYFEALWVERFGGDSAFRDGMRRIREEIVKAPEVASRPVIDTTRPISWRCSTRTAIRRAAGRSTCFVRWSAIRRSFVESIVLPRESALDGAHRRSAARCRGDVGPTVRLVLRPVAPAPWVCRGDDVVALRCDTAPRHRDHCAGHPIRGVSIPVDGRDHRWCRQRATRHARCPRGGDQHRSSFRSSSTPRRAPLRSTPMFGCWLPGERCRNDSCALAPRYRIWTSRCTTSKGAPSGSRFVS